MLKRSPVLERVAPAHLPAVEAAGLGQDVEHALDGEVGLVGPEAAHGAGRRVVGVDGARLDVDVGHAVGAAGMAGGALQDLAADAGVGAVVADHACPDGQQVAVGVAADRVVHPERMALDVEAEALGAAEREQHGPPGGPGQERRLALDVEVLLAAEGATGRDLADEDVLRLEAQERGDLAPVVPGALALRHDVEARAAPSVAVRRPVVPGRRQLRHRQAGLGLEEGVLDAGGGEALRGDVGCPLERRVDVAALDDRERDEVAALVHERRVVGQRRERIGDRRQDVVLDIDERGGLARGLAALRGDRGQHVTDVAGRLALGDEQRPVVHDEPLVPLAGHVRGGQHGDDAGVGGSPRGVDPPNDGTRMVGEPQGAVEHAGRGHVGHVAVLPEGQLAALPARHPSADGGSLRLGGHGRAVTPRGGDQTRWPR